jgi:hypothetical protein
VVTDVVIEISGEWILGRPLRGLWKVEAARLPFLSGKIGLAPPTGRMAMLGPISQKRKTAQVG